MCDKSEWSFFFFFFSYFFFFFFFPFSKWAPSRCRSFFFLFKYGKIKEKRVYKHIHTHTHIYTRRVPYMGNTRPRTTFTPFRHSRLVPFAAESSTIINYLCTRTHARESLSSIIVVARTDSICLLYIYIHISRLGSIDLHPDGMEAHTLPNWYRYIRENAYFAV